MPLELSTEAAPSLPKPPRRVCFRETEKLILNSCGISRNPEQPTKTGLSIQGTITQPYRWKRC